MPYPDDGRGMRHIGFTAPYNMTGQPAATVNAGFLGDGRAVGVQLSGRRFDDLGVLRAAHWYEANRPAGAVPDWPDGIRAGVDSGSGVTDDPRSDAGGPAARVGAGTGSVGS